MDYDNLEVLSENFLDNLPYNFNLPPDNLQSQGKIGIAMADD